jgi:hypothetical protein
VRDVSATSGKLVDVIRAHLAEISSDEDRHEIGVFLDAIGRLS